LHWISNVDNTIHQFGKIRRAEDKPNQMHNIISKHVVGCYTQERSNLSCVSISDIMKNISNSTDTEVDFTGLYRLPLLEDFKDTLDKNLSEMA